ncbi:LacI family transcriptional regulator [Bifidobacterium ramosum]|nr:LacI family DNA-binding transcriptional regulator [Bifidobacterium ramosum]KAB8286902.1 LacI family transcriptional regulator [Bifidobacterium ramosum]
MRDVAKKAGVSLSTVSLVINNGEHVSDDVRSRVEWAMDALHYVPNELARNLSKNRTNTVGVILPTLRHPFFATLFASLQTALEERGMLALPCSTSDMKRGEEEYVDMLRRRMMDGIIMGAHTSHSADYWTSIGHPVVAFDRYLGMGVPTVGSDHEQGSRLVCDLLIRTGARHVVNLGGPRSQFHDLADLLASGADAEYLSTSYHSLSSYLVFRSMLPQAGVRWSFMESGEVDDFDSYARAAHDVFDRYPDADAIVCADITAALCVEEARSRGLRVPEDVQIVAYDGTYVTRLSGGGLTSICQDFDAIARLLTRRLMQLVEGPSAGEVDDAGADRVPMTLRIGSTTR